MVKRKQNNKMSTFFKLLYLYVISGGRHKIEMVVLKHELFFPSKTVRNEILTHFLPQFLLLWMLVFVSLVWCVLVFKLDKGATVSNLQEEMRKTVLQRNRTRSNRGVLGRLTWLEDETAHSICLQAGESDKLVTALPKQLEAS